MKKRIVFILVMMVIMLSSCENEEKIIIEPIEYTSVELQNVVSTTSSIQFDVIIQDDGSNYDISSIYLYNEGVVVKSLIDISQREFTNLLSNTEYIVIISGTYDLNDGFGTRNTTIDSKITTLENEIPSLTYYTTIKTEESIYFTLNIVDDNTFGEISLIELFKGSNLIESLDDLSLREFNNLTLLTEYTIKTTVSYDLNDGLGEQFISYEYTVKTISDTLEYFLDICMSFDNSNIARKTRKWVNPLRIYIEGDPGEELNAELNKIIEEISDLVGNELDISLVSNKSDANFEIFFGTHEAFGKIHPNLTEILEFSDLYFWINFTSNGEIYTGYLFIDTNRPDLLNQKHYLRRGLTAILGLPMTSYKYEDSIFNDHLRILNEYSLMDKQLIWLLYNSHVETGLNDMETREILENIIKNGFPNFK